MAERRMFAKTIIDSDEFLDMPHTSQNLYFHLCMRADDEGFVNKPKMIQRMIGCNDDDLKVLLSKKFIISFESGVIVIKHWMIHNYIRKDRLVETMYKNEKELMTIDENGAYTFNKLNEIVMDDDVTAEEKRKMAYAESGLPYSFDYKIKQAFWHEPCPVCGSNMEVGEFGVRNHIPTIQHNVPISKGGKHELGNISVICLSCNVSIRDTQTDQLNSLEVIRKWDEISMSDKCQPNRSQTPDKCQHRLGKDRLGKDSIGKDIKDICPEPEPALDLTAAISFILNDNSEYWIFEDQVKEWTELFPAVDVMQELRKMKNWLNSNPSRRKTKRGILRFVNGWLCKEQDRPKTQRPVKQSNETFYDDMARWVNEHECE